MSLNCIALTLYVIGGIVQLFGVILLIGPFVRRNNDIHIDGGNVDGHVETLKKGSSHLDDMLGDTLPSLLSIVLLVFGIVCNTTASILSLI